MPALIVPGPHGAVIGAIADLRRNEAPWSPPEHVLDAIAGAARDAQRYPDPGAGVLRQRLAERHSVDVTQVTVSAGATALLQQLIAAYVDPDAEVVRGEPSFELFPHLTRLAGGRDVAVPAVDWTLDVEAMAAAVTDRTRLVMLANPNNPTGTVVPTAAVRALAERLPRGRLLVLDGAYAEMSGDDHGEDLALAAAAPNVVTLRTFSKSFGLAGLRVGWAVAHPTVIAAIDKLLLPFAVPTVSQAAAIASLEVEAEIAERRAETVRERARVEDALRAAGWQFPRSAANFVWLPCPDPDARAANLAAHGVLVRSFPRLGLRVALGSVEDNDRFLSALATTSRTGATVDC